MINTSVNTIIDAMSYIVAVVVDVDVIVVVVNTVSIAVIVIVIVVVVVVVVSLPLITVQLVVVLSHYYRRTSSPCPVSSIGLPVLVEVRPKQHQQK